MGMYPEHLLEVIAEEQGTDIYHDSDCDFCRHQYLCGTYGDAFGCRRRDAGLSCRFEFGDEL